jgi:hypothetical protein
MAPDAIAVLEGLLASCPYSRWSGRDVLRLEVIDGPIPLQRFRDIYGDDFFVTFPNRTIQQAYDDLRDEVLPIGEIANLRVPRNRGRLIVARDLKDLLLIEETQVAEPEALVLFQPESDQLFYSHIRGESWDSAPVFAQRYHAAIRLWSLLQLQADHISSIDNSLLFFGIRRIEISPGFGQDDLESDICVDEIEAFVRETDRQKTRAEIFTSVLSEFLRDQSPARNFRSLLVGSQIFARRLKEGLAIYLADNSPEKLADEARKSELELSEKLEKIIGGLEAKSLSIPAAVLLAVKEVAPGAGITTINLLILGSAIGYGVTMTLVDASQTALLKTLKITLIAKIQELKRKGLEEDNPVLKVSFAGLESRRATAATGSKWMCGLSWIPAVGVIVAMGWGAPVPVISGSPMPVATQAITTSLPRTPSPSSAPSKMP